MNFGPITSVVKTPSAPLERISFVNANSLLRSEMRSSQFEPAYFLLIVGSFFCCYSQELDLRISASALLETGCMNILKSPQTRIGSSIFALRVISSTKSCSSVICCNLFSISAEMPPND